jgi:hypothetical protein
MASRKKISLDAAAAKLASIAEKGLAHLHEEEQDARVEAFLKRNFTSARGIRAGHSGILSPAR